MKCLLCQATVNESQSFDDVVEPNGTILVDTVGRYKLARELETWRYVQIVASISGGSKPLLAGHVCPNHDLSALEIVEGSKS